jgi:GTPase-associated protein 1, N-terminal domain type 1/Effector-associated domain 1
MKVHQAYYGEVRGGHGLLGASGFEVLARQIAPRLDLPDTAPTGVEWSPVVSGFPFQDCYVLAQMSLDTTATRAGMVFSHAFILSLEEICVTENLSGLLELLIASKAQTGSLNAVEFHDSGSTSSTSAELANLAETLLSPGKGPAVRLGTAGFGELIAALWSHLWPSVRRTFAFRLSFGPTDLVEDPLPSVICSPANLVSRWAGYRIVAARSETRESLAVALLTGLSEGQQLLEFSKGIGSSLDSISHLSLLEHAYSRSKAHPSTIEDAIAVLRAVEALSPRPEVGGAAKRVFLNRLVSLMPAASPKQILLLRNLKLMAVGGSQSVWHAVERWSAENPYPEVDDLDSLAVIKDAADESVAVANWRSAILGGFQASTANPNSQFPHAFWRWAQMDASVVRWIFRHAADNTTVETGIVNAAPMVINGHTAKEIVHQAVAHSWFRLHAVAIASIYEPLEAVREQVAVDRDADDDSGIRILTKHLTAEETLAIALEVDEPRVTSIAAEVAAKKPSILADCDFSTTVAQQIWARALARSKSAWNGPKDPAAAFGKVLDSMLEGQPVDGDLIYQISQTPLADVSSYGRRGGLWVNIPVRAREDFLIASAKGWVQRAASGLENTIPEPELQKAVLLLPETDAMLSSLIHRDVASAIHILSLLDDFDESRFVHLLRATRTVSVSDAVAIGKVISDRRWKSAAHDLADLVRQGRADLKQGVVGCESLLDIWTRLRLSLVRLSSPEIWQVAEDLLVELYPSGPDAWGLWERAGGKNGDLVHQGTGRSRWRDALSLIGRGRGVRLESVLEQAKADYPNNDKLRVLMEQFGLPHHSEKR